MPASGHIWRGSWEGGREGFCWLLDPSLVWASPVWGSGTAFGLTTWRERSALLPGQRSRRTGHGWAARWGCRELCGRWGRRLGTSGPAGCRLGSWVGRAPAWPGLGLQEPGRPAHAALAPRGHAGHRLGAHAHVHAPPQHRDQAAAVHQVSAFAPGAGVAGRPRVGPDPPSVAHSALLESLINPLQERIEDWKKSANQLDKDHAKGRSGPRRALQLPTGRNLVIAPLSRSLHRVQTSAARDQEEVFGHAEAAEESTQR